MLGRTSPCSRCSGFDVPASPAFSIPLAPICVVQRRQPFASRWLPVLALARIDAQDKHGVDLFKATSLGLGYEEVHNDCASKAAGGEDVAVAVVDLLRDKWRCKGDVKIGQLAQRRCQGHAHGPVAAWIYLRHQGPGNWAPGHGEAGNEQACEDNHRCADIWGVLGCVLVNSKGPDRCEDLKWLPLASE